MCIHKCLWIEFSVRKIKKKTTTKKNNNEPGKDAPLESTNDQAEVAVCVFAVQWKVSKFGEVVTEIETENLRKPSLAVIASKDIHFISISVIVNHC
jgi:hypothetical protein